MNILETIHDHDRVRIVTDRYTLTISKRSPALFLYNGDGRCLRAAGAFHCWIFGGLV